MAANVTPQPAPRVIITGLARAGLSALHAMVAAGGATAAIFPDPHRPPAPSHPPDGRCLTLFVTRDLRALAMARLRALGIPDPTAGQAWSLAMPLKREEHAARDAAARLFAPLFMFHFDIFSDDPSRAAVRLHNLFAGKQCADLGAPVCPHFLPQAAAAAIWPAQKHCHPGGPVRSTANPGPALTLVSDGDAA